MELEDLKQHCDCFGKTDPLWAILTDPERKSNRWNVEEFFGTGEVWVSDLMLEIEALGVKLSPSGRCLDFGCRVGRMTQGQMQAF